MPRILLFTGKGGVGKTSVAAATALRASERGARTLVVSTDAAHSLADVFGKRIGPEPVTLAERLRGQEIDVHYSVEKHWTTLREYVQRLFRWRGLDDLLAEELSVLPGMEEIAGFLWVNQHYRSGRYDLIVIDSAPTGESLRFLSLPDVGRWWMEKLFPIHRRIVHVLRPAVEAVTDLPVPQERTYDAAAELFREVDSIHTAFVDPAVTSVRLVTNAEQVVLQESQRTFTYLHLFGYSVDAIVLNRLLPPEAGDGYFAEMREDQRRTRERVLEAFAPLPVLEAPLFPREVAGVDMLRQLGESLYAERDPAARLSDGRTFEVKSAGDGRVRLTLPLPLVTKQEVDLTHRGDELIVQVGSSRRSLLLPRALRGRNVERARMEDGALVISFGPPPPASGPPAVDS